MGLPDRALGSTSPILLHDQVEVRVVPLSLDDVPLSLHRLLVSMDGMSVSKYWHRHDKGWQGCANCRV